MSESNKKIRVARRKDVTVPTTQMKKNQIIQKMRDSGMRVTNQRLIILDIILTQQCSTCKEIYYRAVKKDKRIGMATIYRFVNVLEDLNVLSSKNISMMMPDAQNATMDFCLVEFSDHSVRKLSEEEFLRVVQEGMAACNYIDKKKLKGNSVKSLHFTGQTS